VKDMKTIDLPGRFVARDGSLGMKATLADVGYNIKLNFNLLSLTRLLCKRSSARRGSLGKGWHITKGDATGITIENEAGDVIDFDIVIPMSRGAIFACRFI